MGCGSWLSSSWRRERARNVPRTAAMVTDTCAPRPVLRRELLTGWERISRSDRVRAQLRRRRPTFQMPLFSRGEIACARTRPVEFGFCRLEARPSIQIRARSEPSRMASSHPLTYDESGKAPSRRALDYVSPSRQRSIFRFDPPRLGVKGAASIAARGLSQHFQRDGAG